MVQMPFAQSAPVAQPSLVPQRAAHVRPPQSVSVSSPFFSPSLQAGAHAPTSQTPPRQSVPSLHALAYPHGGHMDPPQSMSVSSPFAVLSSQAGGWQKL